MGSVGSWWTARRQRDSGEVVRTAWYVNRWRNGGRPHGGKLYLTNRSLSFHPHFIDVLFGAQMQCHELAEIDEVSAGQPDNSSDSCDPPTEHLNLELRDGSKHQYIITEPASIADAILDEIVAEASNMK